MSTASSRARPLVGTCIASHGSSAKRVMTWRDEDRSTNASTGNKICAGRLCIVCRPAATHARRTSAASARAHDNAATTPNDEHTHNHMTTHSGDARHLFPKRRGREREIAAGRRLAHAAAPAAAAVCKQRRSVDTCCHGNAARTVAASGAKRVQTVRDVESTASRSRSTFARRPNTR